MSIWMKQEWNHWVDVMDKVIFDQNSQTHVMLTAETIQQFIRSKKSSALLAALKPLSVESKAHILMSQNVVLFLTSSGHCTDVLQMIQTLGSDQIFKILNSGNALEGFLRSEKSRDTVWALIKKLQPDHQAALLSKPYIVARHFTDTKERALEVVEVIANLLPDQQADILSTHYTVSALSKVGMALDVFGLIAKLDHYQRDRIAVAKGYQDVSSFCSRRHAKRQTPIHLEMLANSSSAASHAAVAFEK